MRVETMRSFGKLRMTGSWIRCEVYPEKDVSHEVGWASCPTRPSRQERTDKSGVPIGVVGDVHPTNSVKRTESGKRDRRFKSLAWA
jgi:hypothetical protein